MPQILIVDNEEKFCKVIKASLELEALPATYVTSGEAALAHLSENTVDVIISDLRMDGISGMALLEQVKQQYPQTEFIMMTAYATQQTAIEALKKGAFDYLIKPFPDMDELTLRIRRILDQQRLIAENQRLKKQDETPVFFSEMIGKSKKMQQIYRLIKKASENDATVLVRGESGTGKELVAHAIHGSSQRKNKPFVTVNCAALPENLLESELFGFEKGAFTGATHRRIGKFEQAGGGSIFLDEIGDISPATQAKLLRVLQNKEIYRLGSNERIIVDVRIIAATHQNLEEMVESGRFRQDLYYRLNVFQLTLPTLRERKEDIPALVHHFVAQSAAQDIDRLALAELMDYDWPGNVRELQNAIERAAIVCNGMITREDLPSTRKMIAHSAKPGEFVLPDSGIKLDDFEKKLIRQALEKADGNRTHAAELLGITRRRLYSMMERFGINPDG
ncbi:MAG: sigma-54 dependent transcriptional regulator [Calditrichia bacterium]|nr:sigma-54-dependent Fis family transcriptional regulator [Calditrichota bacterium]MCB0268234.1 sigma-54-dependent Fis family transcriptional regulator [Calditrichota bacterium]MCB0286412.1 sigma-54-dependent Fis family transcriptional regulator [Calditrichota bacterium]MCB9067545.1 sigma-54-dependent Fis family transcriptional regulator [Calditrichia bacterium]